MRQIRNLWIATLHAPVAHAEILSDLMGEGAVSLTVMAPPRVETALIEAIFDSEPTEGELSARVAVYAALQGIDLPAVEIRPAPSLDWLKKVAEDFPPLKIARWTVHGALHRARVPNRLMALQIDATSAFGTGEHPTTQGCLLMLDKFLKNGFRPQRMADIGCGSGILAMAAEKVSRGTAVAVDLDQDSVLVARGNMRRNGMTNNVRVGHSRGYAAPLVRAHAPYDLIMANIFARPLMQIAKDLKKNLRPGGRVILSGLLNTQAKGVIAAHRMQGLALVSRLVLGEWSVLAFRHRDGA